MITDRELDDRLAAAAASGSVEVPALPEGFLAALRAEADEPASVVAARQLVDDARRGRPPAAPPARSGPGGGGCARPRRSMDHGRVRRAP